MYAKIVVRLLDDAGVLLGWAPLLAFGREGALRATHPVVITIEQAGRPAWLSYHWADLNVQSRVPYPPKNLDLVPGDRVPLEFADNVVIRIPSDQGPLPPVTVRESVVISVPTGVLGAEGTG